METNTPGQIFGVTSKTDGKSRSRTTNISEEFTQGPKAEEYETHDTSATNEKPIERRQNQNFFKFLGFLICVGLSGYLYQQMEIDRMSARREQAIADQKKRNELAIGFSDA